jgi:hypothetical protein
MKKPLKILVGMLALCACASATELALLQNGFSIRHDHREVIGSITRLFIGTDNTSFVDVPTIQIVHFERDMTPTIPAESKSAGTKAQSGTVPPATSFAAPPKPPIKAPALADVINSAGDRHNIDPDLISSVIHAESGFNARALSPKGAQGLMQLMPKTAANLGVSNAFDPGANVEGGTKYLSELLEFYNFDIIKALAAYNAGPLRVRQYHGVPPYNETRAYVARIIRDFNRKKLAEQKAAAVAAKTKKQTARKTPPATEFVVEKPNRTTAQ